MVHINKTFESRREYPREENTKARGNDIGEAGVAKERGRKRWERTERCIETDRERKTDRLNMILATGPLKVLMETGVLYKTCISSQVLN